jgi:hypothetical protein
VATDGSVLFGVSYHSWLVSTKTEHIYLWGGGPGDRLPLYMTSYRSEPGGICEGLAELGVLTQSGRINTRSVRMVCDNEVAVKLCNQKLTTRIYASTESDWDLLKTYHILQDEWCKEIPMGQGTRGQGREGIDTIRAAEHRGRSTRRHFPVEEKMLFIQGTYETATGITALGWKTKGLHH